EFVDLSFARPGCGRWAADSYAWPGRTECDWPRTRRGVGSDSHRRIARGRRTLWRASVFHPRARLWFFKERRPNNEDLGQHRVGRYGAGHSHVSPGIGDQWLGRRAFRTWSASSERHTHAAGGSCGCGPKNVSGPNFSRINALEGNAGSALGAGEI